MDTARFQAKLLESGSQFGFSDMEIFYSRTQNFSAKAFHSRVDDYQLSDVQGVGFRGFYHGRLGYSYSEILDQESVSLLVQQAAQNSEVLDDPDEQEIYGGSVDYPAVTAYNQDLAHVSVEDKLGMALALEEAALAADKRVRQVNYALYGDEDEEISLVNSRGLSQSFHRNSCVLYVSVVAQDNDRVKTAGRYVVTNQWAKLDPRVLAEEAAEEAVSMLTARSLPPGSYPVVLRNRAAADLIKTFVSLFSADAVQKGLSRLEGCLGETVATSALTLRDDPLLPNGAGSQPFDGEGVACRQKDVIRDGELMTFLHNLKTARKDGVSSTGNAYRPSVKASVSIAPSNFFVQPGLISEKQLISCVQDGLYIADMQGLHSGANAVSGDFSLAASGYRIRDGHLAEPVDQITAAGNFLELLKSVEGVADNLAFGLPGGGGSTGSPSLLVRSLAVSGG